MILMQQPTLGGAALKALSLRQRSGEGKMGITGVSNLKAWAALLVVGLLVTLLVLTLSACGGAGGSAQEGEQAKEEEQANKVHHIPEDSQVYEGKPLPAGHYVTEEFRPPMSFDLDTGWTRGGTENRDARDM